MTAFMVLDALGVCLLAAALLILWGSSRWDRED